MRNIATERWGEAYQYVLNPYQQVVHRDAQKRNKKNMCPLGFDPRSLGWKVRALATTVIIYSCENPLAKG